MHRLPGVATLALLLSATLVGTGSACTEIVVAAPYGYAYPSETISSRSMDFPFTESQEWYVAYVPAGTVINRIKTRSTAPSPPAKHGFVCLAGSSAPARDEAGYGPTQPGFCSDGLNTAGLSGSFLWQDKDEANITFAGYAPDVETDKLTIAYWDMLSFVLGTCDTVACASNFVETVPIVTTDQLATGLQLLLGLPSAPLHATFTDASGASIVVEWTAGQGKPVVTAQPHPNGGVFTNGGTYPFLQELTNAYITQAKTVFNNVYGGDLALAAYPGGLIWGNQPLATAAVNATLQHGQLPLGIQNSASRFVRTSMLRDLVGPVAWGSPNYTLSPEAYGSLTAAAMQADTIMNSAAIPSKFPACMPACSGSPEPEDGVYSGQNEITLWRTLRDHKKPTYWVKTVYNPTYHRIDLAKHLAAAPPNVATVERLSDVVSPTWWRDAPLPGAAAKAADIKASVRAAMEGVKQDTKAAAKSV